MIYHRAWWERGRGETARAKIMKSLWIIRACAAAIVALCFATAFVEGANLAFDAAAGTVR